MNNKLKTERKTQKLKSAECEKAVSLSCWLYALSIYSATNDKIFFLKALNFLMNFIISLGRLFIEDSVTSFSSNIFKSFFRCRLYFALLICPFSSIVQKECITVFRNTINAFNSTKSSSVSFFNSSLYKSL